jgi:hypothetical protein
MILELSFLDLIFSSRRKYFVNMPGKKEQLTGKLLKLLGQWTVIRKSMLNHGVSPLLRFCSVDLCFHISLSMCVHTHIHTHTYMHTYIYIYFAGTGV